MNVQLIERDGTPEWAVIPYNEYKRLVRVDEAFEDIRAFDEAKSAIADGEELVPASVTFALLDGESPIRVWRGHRQLTLQALADMANISKSYLSQLESGTRRGTADVLQRIAQALDVTLDDLLRFTE